MKTKRQAKIIEIISNTNVETQEQLLKALEEAGLPVSAPIATAFRKRTPLRR